LLAELVEKKVSDDRKVTQFETNKKKLEGDLLALKGEKVKVEEALKSKEEELKKKTSEYVTVEENKL